MVAAANKITDSSNKMSDIVSIPTYDGTSSLDLYEQEVEAWKVVTGYTDKKKQAIVLVL